MKKRIRKRRFNVRVGLPKGITQPAYNEPRQSAMDYFMNYESQIEEAIDAVLCEGYKSTILTRLFGKYKGLQRSLEVDGNNVSWSHIPDDDIVEKPAADVTEEEYKDSMIFWLPRRDLLKNVLPGGDAAGISSKVEFYDKDSGLEISQNLYAPFAVTKAGNPLSTRTHGAMHWAFQNSSRNVDKLALLQKYASTAIVLSSEALEKWDKTQLRVIRTHSRAGADNTVDEFERMHKKYIQAAMADRHTPASVKRLFGQLRHKVEIALETTENEIISTGEVSSDVTSATHVLVSLMASALGTYYDIQTKFRQLHDPKNTAHELSWTKRRLGGVILDLKHQIREVDAAFLKYERALMHSGDHESD